MEKFWLKQAGKVAVQVNCARWLEFAAPAAALWSCAAGCFLLAIRRMGWSATPLAAASFVALASIAAVASWKMRRNWFSRRDGLVRLDAILGIHNRLSSAAEGIGTWPPAAACIQSGLRWRWERVGAPLAVAAAFLLAAIWVPITTEKAVAAVKIEPPLAWTQVEAAIEELKREEVSDPEALAGLEQKLELLRQQSQESWYSQSSLEAGASLRDETGHAIAALEKNLDSASKALAQPGQPPSGAASISPEKEASWNEALKGLQSGALPLNKADLSALKQCTNCKSSLSPQQVQALQKKLGQKGVCCKSALAKAGEILSERKTEALETPQDQPNCRGGGGKTAPLGIREKPTALQPEKEEGLDGKDMENAALGDVINVTTGTHKVDPSEAPKPAAGGAISSAGSGGDAVWKIAPTPKEQAVLKEYFK